MNFEDFQNEFIKENRKLKILITFCLIIFSIGTALLFTQRKYYLYKGNSLFLERPLAEEICRAGFLSLVSEEPNKYLIDSSIVEMVKKDPFLVVVSKIYFVKSLELNTCKIIIKSENEILGFKIYLSASDKNPFYYKLIQIDEINVNKGDV